MNRIFQDFVLGFILLNPVNPVEKIKEFAGESHRPR